MNPLSGAIHCRDNGLMTINRAYEDLLAALDLDDVDAVWDCTGGETIKQIPQRSVTRLKVSWNGQTRLLYLKRHRPLRMGLSGRIRQQGEQRYSQGRIEFDHICRFRENGFATVSPVACGEKRRGDHVVSFLITEDFYPFVSLEEIIRHRPEFFSGTAGGRRKDILLETVGRLARRMHRCGLNHRDFNATHILLHYAEGCEQPETALFDLQRVDRDSFFRFRWPIRTLARVGQTLPATLFTEADRLTLFRAYKGKAMLNLRDRFQRFWIHRKTARISRHTEKIMARKAKHMKP